jgi:hypothetical protein
MARDADAHGRMGACLEVCQIRLTFLQSHENTAFLPSVAAHVWEETHLFSNDASRASGDAKTSRSGAEQVVSNISSLRRDSVNEVKPKDICVAEKC